MHGRTNISDLAEDLLNNNPSLFALGSISTETAMIQVAGNSQAGFECSCGVQLEPAGWVGEHVIQKMARSCKARVL